MITVGGTLAKRSLRAWPPRIEMSSSLTILTICCAGFSAPETSAPLARSLIRVELPDHGERHVRLEQDNADLAEGRVDIGSRQLALPPQ